MRTFVEIFSKKLNPPLPTMNSYRFLRKNELLRGENNNLNLKQVSKYADLKKILKTSPIKVSKLF